MIRVAILTVSDSVVKGTREDRSGAGLRTRIEALGWAVAATGVVSDDVEHIAARLREWADGKADVILTTGGTGVAARDVTPEAVRAVIDREIPGMGELMRSEGLKSTPLAPLSRSLAGSRGSVFVACLPGSPKGAMESLSAIEHLIPHVVDLLQGRTEHSVARN
jgi:molybdopterin adenylyltransferase